MISITIVYGFRVSPIFVENVQETCNCDVNVFVIVLTFQLHCCQITKFK
jgi:hypothetical protein